MDQTQREEGLRNLLILQEDIQRKFLYIVNKYQRVDGRLKAPFREFIKFARDHVDEMDILLAEMKAHEMTRDAVGTSPQTFGLLRKIFNALGANFVKGAVLFIGAGGSFAFKN